MIIEISLKNGDFNLWTPERIKGAFKFGHGTIEDLKRYAEDNKQFCRVVFDSNEAEEYIKSHSE